MLSSGIAFAEGIGYWMHHDEERNAFIGSAVSLSSVFASTSSLNNALQRKGKKLMEEKAMQQHAALLLNVASSLSDSALLTAGELEIYNQIVDPDVTQATVGDAVSVIETVINVFDTSNLENAKDLAEEINHW
jgi:hypothetical protein